MRIHAALPSSLVPRRADGRALRGLRATLLVLGAVIAPFAVALSHAAPEASEAEIKAAFLVRFGNYIDWPAGGASAASAPFGIDVLGDSAIAAELERAASHSQVASRAIQVRRLAPGDSLGDARIVFLARSESGRLGEVLASARDQPILVVTEVDGAVPSGAALNFVVVDNKVRFDVDLTAAEAAHLKISARLLSVAHRVIGAPR